MTADFDATVIGAGVIGLAVARELCLYGQNVLVLESAPRAGTETSARNSEVVHAGIYYPTGTLKARLSVEGRSLLYDYCSNHGVATRKLGKIIVACNPAEEAKLASIKSLAEANGVKDLEWLSTSEVARLEPEISCTKAILSPSTGIVDAGALMLSLHAVAEARGVTFAFNTKFAGAQRRGDEFVIQAGGAEFTSTAILNCTGHGAHQAATAVMGYDPRHLPPKFFARGSYCSVSGGTPFQHLVYPVPVAGALGIHATLDMAGAVRFGPNIQWIDRVDYSLPNDLPEVFQNSIAAYWPGVRTRELTPSYCGVRPKIHGPTETFADFMIQTEAAHGIAKLTNLFGIESPGLTAALAIGKAVMGGPF